MQTGTQGIGFRNSLTTLVPAIVLAVAALTGMSRAVDVMNIPTPDGKPFVALNIFNKGELFGSEKYESVGEVSAWTLSAAERDGLRNGVSYWANIIGPVLTAVVPGGITVGTYVYENADAMSLPDPKTGATELARSLLHGWQSVDAAQIRIGWLGGGPDTWNSAATMRVLPDNGDRPPLASTMAHELGHALGVFSSRIRGAETLTTFDSYLVDAAGNPASLGQNVVRIEDGDNFYLPDSGYAFFQGGKVLETLGGAILGGTRNFKKIVGIPINGWEGDTPELSHLELDRSMMSHQRYSNYTGFMEAELAVLVDIGYNIDIKNFYGKSIYKSGETINNTEGFSARNSEGTVYVPGRYNASPAAIGLHVYGDSNIITQRADILSSGFGSAGIRIDSSGVTGNKLTIAEGVKVHADGALGTGLMAAYGKGHEIIHRGDLRAAGLGGVAARFDFGSNVLGNTFEYRGSFIHTLNAGNALLLPELNGALVSSFDVTGSLTGADKAIYISENAFVENINIMGGASIRGDIVSDWNTSTSRIQGGRTHITSLTFGLAADSDGKATVNADANFSLQYEGNIQSLDRGLDVSLKGGKLDYFGNITVNNFTAESGIIFTASAFGTPTIIDANKITFDTGSSISLSAGGFVYGTTDASTATVLRLDSSLVTNNATVLSSSGSFSAGLHDYIYNTPRLDAGGNLVISLSNPQVNETRAATSAVSAPSVMLSRNDAADMLSARMGDNFAAMGNDGETADGTGSAAALASLAGRRDGAVRRRAIWATPGFGYAASRGAGGFTIRGPTWGVGYTHWLNAYGYVGVAIGGAAPNYRSSDADVNSFALSPSLYAGARLPYDIDIGGFAQYGYVHNRQTRRVAAEAYSSSYNGNGLSAGVQLGRAFEVTPRFALRPFASYQFSHFRTDGYDEGAGTFALDISSRSDTLHFLRVGGGAAYSFANGAYVSGKAYYAGLYGDTRNAVNVSFIQDPARNVYSSLATALDRHSLGLGAGVGIPLGQRAELSATYTFLIGKSTMSHQAELGVQVKF